MYDTYMSTPGNTAKLGATHSSIATDSTKRSVPGWEQTLLRFVFSVKHSSLELTENCLTSHHINICMDTYIYPT